MNQNPPRRSPNVAAIVVLGFFASALAEFVLDLVIEFGGLVHSQSAANVVSVLLSLVIGAVAGGAIFLARPRHYGLAAVAAVSGIVADELATAVYFLAKDLPVSVGLFTGYFTHARAVFWISNVIVIAVAAGLTAIRVARVRTGEPSVPPRTWAPPGPQWGPPPPYGPPQPYGPPPQQSPYGPPAGPYGPSAGEPPG